MEWGLKKDIFFLLEMKLTYLNLCINRWNNDFRDRWIEIWIPNERPLQRAPGLAKIHQTGSRSYPRPTLWWINNHRFIESRVGRTISHRTLLFIIYIHTVDHFWKTCRPDDHRSAIGCWKPAVSDHFEDRTTFLRGKTHHFGERLVLFFRQQV